MRNTKKNSAMPLFISRHSNNTFNKERGRGGREKGGGESCMVGEGRNSDEERRGEE